MSRYEIIEPQELMAFVRESNKIEGITRSVTDDELSAYYALLARDGFSNRHIGRFVTIIQPGAELRNRPGMNVSVGNHLAPPGGERIGELLAIFLEKIATPHPQFKYIESPTRLAPHLAHHEYETLHPFMDGNGRSGRALWLWMHLRADTYRGLGFLHQWYYESLENWR